jgi:hypothetical protein
MREPACLFDFAYIADSNVSVNKVNYFVKRESVRSIKIAETGAIDETITLSYKNTSTGDSGGGGHFRNYSQIYIADATIKALPRQELVRQRPSTKRRASTPFTERRLARRWWLVLF